jgi:hypothetical protein
MAYAYVIRGGRWPVRYPLRVERAGCLPRIISRLRQIRRQGPVASGAGNLVSLRFLLDTFPDPNSFRLLGQIVFRKAKIARLPIPTKKDSVVRIKITRKTLFKNTGVSLGGFLSIISFTPKM